MKIALVNPDAFSVWQFRRGLINTLVKNGADVHVVCADDAFTDRVKVLNITYHSVIFNRFINPVKDLKYLFDLYHLFYKEHYDIVHNFSIKPNIYGAMAAKFSGINHIVATVEGLGFTFSYSGGLKFKFMKILVKFLFCIAFGLSDRVWFLNNDDMQVLLNHNIVCKKKCVLIVSIGVNITEYSLSSVNAIQLEKLRSEIGSNNNSLFVSMIVSRLVWSKGVGEFIKAAASLVTDLPNVSFILVGPVDEASPDAVPRELLIKDLPENIWWSNFREDIKELLSLSDIVVLPSYYGEGVPRILLEAMAMQKPIVTTDNVGCREVVEEGRNGYLVPIKDVNALRNVIKVLADNDDMRIRFGQYSRVKVEKEFDEIYVNNRIMEELYGINQCH